MQRESTRDYRSFWLIVILGALVVLGRIAFAWADEPVKAAKAKIIDLVLCLDTSSSMDGLIDSAKKKMWDVVNDLAKAKPTPNLRVSVYSYGNNAYDPATGWVRQELELTSDLDRVSEKLVKLAATKVGGSEEYVGRVCHHAIHQLKWCEDRGALKIIFVCGNEPANQDPEIALKTLAETAARKEIVINTIFCGSATDPVAAGWKQFADLAEGRFMAIDQNRATVAINAPQDKELAELSAKLNTTFCFYGVAAKSLAQNQVQQDVNALRLGGGVAASRAVSKGGEIYRFEDSDLVEKVKRDGAFDVKKVPAAELPDELKKMTPEDREKHVKKLLVQREELQKRITDLAKQRDGYVLEENRKNAGSADKAFDEAVRGVLREQAKKKGIEIPK